MKRLTKTEANRHEVLSTTPLKALTEAERAEMRGYTQRVTFHTELTRLEKAMATANRKYFKHLESSF